MGVLLSVFIGSASAKTGTRSEKWNLEGTWKLSVGYFEFQPSGGCMVKTPTGDVGALKDAPIAISRSNSGYSIQINALVGIKVSGNRFSFTEKVGSNRTEWVGTISQELDQSRRMVVTRISGIETCNNQATLPFTFVREDVAQNTAASKKEPTQKDIDEALKTRGFPASNYPYYEAPNGCSNSPDSNWFNSGTGFKPACDDHDRCYATVGQSKDACDDKFKDDMDKICATGTPVIGCNTAASLYHGAVIEKATCAYAIAQVEARKYQDKVEEFKKEWRQKIGR